VIWAALANLIRDALGIFAKVIVGVLDAVADTWQDDV
jgi:hypothetical protein